MKPVSSLRVVVILLIGSLCGLWASAAIAATITGGRFYLADTNATLPEKSGLTSGTASGQHFTSDNKGVSGVKLDFDSLAGGADAGQFTLNMATPTRPGAWAATTVDSDGRVGEYSAIAVDGGGAVHISYYYNDIPSLKYATNAGGSWSMQSVHTRSTGIFGSGNIGWFSDIAVADDGTVHICYVGQEKGRLWYAKNAGAGWMFTEIDKTGRVGDTPALTVTSDGIVHITYHEELVDTLKYAAGISGHWKVETAGDTGYAATPEGNRAGAMVADTDGDAVMEIADIRIDNPGLVNHYAIDPDGGEQPCGGAALVMPAESCTVAVDFTPKAEGKRYATLEIDSNDPDKPELGIEMTGSGNLLTGTSVVNAAPGSYDFGNLTVGKTSLPVEIQLRNLGEEPLNINDIYIAPPPLHFGVNLDGSNPCAATPFTLNANDACTVTVAFHPAETGMINDALKIASDDETRPLLEIPLHGTGSPPLVVPSLSLSPNALAFGTVNVGGQSARQTVTIENTGGENLLVDGLTLSDDVNFVIEHFPATASSPCGDLPVRPERHCPGPKAAFRLLMFAHNIRLHGTAKLESFNGRYCLGRLICL